MARCVSGHFMGFGGGKVPDSVRLMYPSRSAVFATLLGFFILKLKKL